MIFDRHGLEAFERATEKQPPPVFVGREEILADIEERGRLAWKGGASAARGVPGATRLLQGAPGAGKTSILTEMQTRFMELVRTQSKTPRVVILSSSSLMKDLAGAVAEIGASARASKTDWYGMVANIAKRISSVSAFGASIGFDNLSAGQIPHLGVLKRELPPEKWVAPVIVAVDEAQNLVGDKGALFSMFLQDIHNASEHLPLTLVLAGLGDTRDVARKCGLTRGLTTHEIGCLAPADVDLLMTGFCRHFRLNPIGHETRLSELAAPAEGWPRHLHFTMQSLAREALAVDGDLNRVDWGQADRDATVSRQRYYLDQRSPAMEASDILTSSVLASLGPAMSRRCVLELIEKNVQDKPGRRLPKEMDVEDFLTHLIHQGALQQQNGIYRCPIPSFRTYLVKAAGRDPAPDP